MCAHSAGRLASGQTKATSFELLPVGGNNNLKYATPALVHPTGKHLHLHLQLAARTRPDARTRRDASLSPARRATIKPDRPTDRRPDKIASALAYMCAPPAEPDLIIVPAVMRLRAPARVRVT